VVVAVTTAIVVDTITIINNNDIDEALKVWFGRAGLFLYPSLLRFFNSPGPTYLLAYNRITFILYISST